MNIRTIALSLALFTSTLRADLAAPNPGNLIGGVTSPSQCGDPAAAYGINIVSGDASRSVTDIVVPGAVGGAFTFTRTGHSRYINTQTRFFGFGNNWRHNWQWECASINSGGTAGFAIYFPDGTTKNFWKVGTTNVYAEEAYQGGRIVEAAGSGHLTLTQPDGWKFTINKVTSYQYINGQYVQVTVYRMVSQLPPGGAATTLSWDSYSNRLTQVTEPGGRYMYLSYTTVSHTNDTYYDLDDENTDPQPVGDDWYEFTTTSAGATARRYFRYIGPTSELVNGSPNESYSRIAELEFRDENNNVIGGTAIGSEEADADHLPLKAFDGNATTYFKASTIAGGWVGLDPGASKKCSKIRFKLATGSSLAEVLAGKFQAMDTVAQSSAVISSVYSMYGGYVSYSYTVQTDTENPTLYSTPVLSSVSQSPDTTANYTYVQQASLVRPVLETADDKRVNGSLTKGKWEYWPLYDPNAGNFSGTSPIGVVKKVLWNSSGSTYTEIAQIGDESGEHVARFPTVSPNSGNTDWRVTATSASWGLPTQKKDPLGRTTTFAYHRHDGSSWVSSDVGYMKEVKEPGASSGTWRTTTMTHTLIGNVLTATRPDGSVDTYDRGNSTSSPLELPLSHTLSHDNQTPAFTSRYTAYTYDSNYRLTQIMYHDANTENWTYNSLCQPLTHTLRNGFNESFAYGSSGLMTSRTDAEGNVTTLSYSSDRVSSVVVTRGSGDTLTTSYAYNARHQVTTITHPGNKTTKYDYDAYGNRTHYRNELSTGTFPGSSTHMWVTTYDALRRKLSETDPLSRTTNYAYDAPGGGGGCCGGGGSGHLHEITLPSNKKVAYEYDKTGARTKEIHDAHLAAENQTHTDSAYKANDGTLESTTDPLGKTTSFAYDSRKRRVSQTDPLNHTTSWTYDAAGNTLSTTRPGSNVSSSAYDVMNRVTSTTDPENHTTSYQYGRVQANDGGDTVHKITDANNNVTTFEHDKLARRTKTIHPAVGGSSAQETWTYDGVGNIKTYTNRAGAVLTNTYDNRNRNTLADWSDSTPDVTTAYDDAGRVTSQSNSVSTLTYAYNPGSELTSEIQDIAAIGAMSGYNPPSRTVAYTYNSDGQRATLTYPDSTALTFTYSDRNQPDTITSSGTTLVDYDYDAAGNRTMKKLMPGGGAATYAHRVFDDFNRVGRVAIGTGSTEYTNENTVFYTGYDDLNRRTSHTESNPNGNKTDTFSYTADDQLNVAKYNYNAQAQTQDQLVDYDHDAAHNRDTVAKTAGSTTITDDYAANALNQYTSITPSITAPVTTLGYDTNGNLNSVADGTNTRTFSYDAQNRLLGTNITGDVQTYAYDPRGRVAYRIVASALRVQVWDGWNLIEDRDGSGNQAAEYIHGAEGELLSIEVSSTKTYYHHDATGNVVALTNASAAIVERYKYDLFGNPTITDAGGTALSPQLSGCGNRWMFKGMEWVATSAANAPGLYDIRTHVYASIIGRVVNVDKFGNILLEEKRAAGNNEFTFTCACPPASQIEAEVGLFQLDNPTCIFLNAYFTNDPGPDGRVVEKIQPDGCVCVYLCMDATGRVIKKIPGNVRKKTGPRPPNSPDWQPLPQNPRFNGEPAPRPNEPPRPGYA